MKKGFTLIELLAVIVILAIIALIATPIVLNIINDTKESATLRSADYYLNALELSIAQSILHNKTITDGTYTIMSDGNVCLGTLENNTCSADILEVESNGTKPVDGTLVIQNGKIITEETNVIYDNLTIIFNNGVAEVKVPLILCKATAPIKQDIYSLDMQTAQIISTPTTVGVQATEQAPYEAGSVYYCNLGDGDRLFYVLSESDDDVRLIMNENIGISEWSTNGSASEGPITANEFLKTQTSEWTRLKDVNGALELPNESDLGSQGPLWTTTNVGNNSQYWLSSHPNYSDANGVYAYIVLYSGSTTWTQIDGKHGIRPVIIISKENMSL